MQIEIPVGDSFIKGILEEPNENEGNKCLAIVCNGIFSTMDEFSYASKGFCEKGIACFRFNYRNAPPDYENFWKLSLSSEAQDLKAVCEHFAKSGEFEKISIVAFSMSGLVSAIAGLSVSSFVFWSPVVEPNKVKISLNEISREQERELLETGKTKIIRKRTGDFFYAGREMIREIREIDGRTLYPRIKAPSLVLYAGSDSLVPREQAEFLEKLHGFKLEVIEKCNHAWLDEERKNPDEKARKEVIEKTIKWIKGH
jgi:dienelactone hydrolase